PRASSLVFAFCNAPAPPEIHTLSLHDALPISMSPAKMAVSRRQATNSTPAPYRTRAWVSQASMSVSGMGGGRSSARLTRADGERSEEHTSELQSRENLVCRLLLEKKKSETYTE